MNITFTLLAALPLGLLVRSRGTAALAFLIAESFVFTFQTLGVLLTWMAGRTGLGGASGFGPSPDAWPVPYAESEIIAYGIVNLIIVLAGIGLVLLGHRIRARRAAARHAVTVG